MSERKMHPFLPDRIYGEHVCGLCGAGPGAAWHQMSGAGTLPPANARQEGGSHYQMPIQSWDYITANGLGYLEGNIIKYVTRWRRKGGIGDLLKAEHYLQKLKELAYAEKAAAEKPQHQGVPLTGGLGYLDI